MKVHPAANLLPELPESEFADLKADIAARGLREAILRKEGLIIDGRHKLKACEQLSIEPFFQEYAGSDITAEILSRNILRRHLTATQRGVSGKTARRQTHRRRTSTATLWTEKGRPSSRCAEISVTGRTRGNCRANRKNRTGRPGYCAPRFACSQGRSSPQEKTEAPDRQAGSKIRHRPVAEVV